MIVLVEVVFVKKQRKKVVTRKTKRVLSVIERVRFFYGGGGFSKNDLLEKKVNLLNMMTQGEK